MSGFWVTSLSSGFKIIFLTSQEALPLADSYDWFPRDSPAIVSISCFFFQMIKKRLQIDLTPIPIISIMSMSLNIFIFSPEKTRLVFFTAGHVKKNALIFVKTSEISVILALILESTPKTGENFIRVHLWLNQKCYPLKHNNYSATLTPQNALCVIFSCEVTQIKSKL